MGDSSSEESDTPRTEYDELLPVVEAQRSIAQQLTACGFMEHIFESGKMSVLNRVTSPIPLDPYAGLLHVHERIWNPAKVAVLIIKFLQICLNVTYILLNFRQSWFRHSLVFAEGGNSIALMGDHAKACVKSPNFGEELQCIETDLKRFYSYRAITTVEAVMVLPLAAAVLLITIGFVLGCGKLRKLPSRHPWFFFFAPGAILSASVLMCWQLVHPARIHALWQLDERKFWRRLIFFSIWKPSETDLTEEEDERATKKQERCCYHLLMNCLGLCIYVAGILLAFQGSLIKLSAVHFASIVNCFEWNLREWAMVLGFFNQIASTINPNILEMHRLLLFQFGRSNVLWTKSRVFCAHSFLVLLAHRIVEGRVGKECVLGGMPIGALAVMWSFSATDLQCLLYCPLREERLEQGRSYRMEFLSDLWDPALQQKYKEDLQEYQESGKGNIQDVLDSEKGRLSAERDFLLREISAEAAEDKHADVPMSTRLLLVAEIQNSVEDVNCIDIHHCHNE